MLKSSQYGDPSDYSGIFQRDINSLCFKDIMCEYT